MAYRVAISWGGEDFSDSKAPLKIRMMEPVLIFFFFLKGFNGSPSQYNWGHHFEPLNFSLLFRASIVTTSLVSLFAGSQQEQLNVCAVSFLRSACTTTFSAKEGEHICMVRCEFSFFRSSSPLTKKT